MRRTLAPLPLLFAILALTPVSAQTVTQLASFTSTTGEAPNGGLIEASDGNYYGTTTAGGTLGGGTLFKVTSTGSITVLHNFDPDAEGYFVSSSLIQGTDGNFYGTLVNGGINGGGSVFKFTPAGSITILHSFSGPDGNSPFGGVVEASNGTFYGTTDGGGANSIGTIYSITSAGAFNMLYQFAGPDASAPIASLLQGSDGKLYGNSSGGGANGDGAFFSYTIGGTLKTIYSSASPLDATPDGPLVEGSDGNFYGTSDFGGANEDGAIYQLTPSGTLTLLYSFTDENDGSNPYANLDLGSDGAFYGTANQGGTGENGTLYKVTYAGAVTPLYSFPAPTGDTSEFPWAPFIQGSDGVLYSVTGDGGSGSEGSMYSLSFTHALAAPVQLSLSQPQIALGSSVTLNWSVLNAFSMTMQRCAAFVQGAVTGAGTWTGLQTGVLANNIYAGSATFTPSAAGTYTYALTCGGQESGFATLTVTSAGKSNTSTALSVSPSPITVGQPATLQATVTGSGATPTGSVTFYHGSHALITVGVKSGVASFTASTNGLPPGTYPLTAKYSGDSTHNSSSGTDSATLGKAATVTTLTVSPGSVTPPANVTLSATVKRSASGATGIPTGSVTFYANGSDVLATVKLNSSGIASITASSKGYPAGKYVLTARYLGDSSDTTSTSAGVDITLQ